MKHSTKVSLIVGLILLFTAVAQVYRTATTSVILWGPISLQTGADISETFTVHRAGSYDVEIDCERNAGVDNRDLDDALRDGLDADVQITSERESIKVDSDPERFMYGTGLFSRVLGTFEAVPRKTYNLTLHIIRYGQGISARDHKLAGTWDENLTIPQEAHPKLKIEIDPLVHKRDGVWFFAGVIGLICLVSPVTFGMRRILKRTPAPI